MNFAEGKRRGCPACGAPLGWLEVLAVPTPFHRLRCRGCGALLRLRRRGRWTAAALVLGLALGWAAVSLWWRGLLPRSWGLLGSFGVLALVEGAAAWWLSRRPAFAVDEPGVRPER